VAFAPNDWFYFSYRFFFLPLLRRSFFWKLEAWGGRALRSSLLRGLEGLSRIQVKFFLFPPPVISRNFRLSSRVFHSRSDSLPHFSESVYLLPPFFTLFFCNVAPWMQFASFFFAPPESFFFLSRAWGLYLLDQPFCTQAPRTAAPILLVPSFPIYEDAGFGVVSLRLGECYSLSMIFLLSFVFSLFDRELAIVIDRPSVSLVSLEKRRNNGFFSFLVMGVPPSLAGSRIGLLLSL